MIICTPSESGQIRSYLILHGDSYTQGYTISGSQEIVRCDLIVESTPH